MENVTYFYVDAFPAGSGDCFMVRCSDGQKKANILIDGGFIDTYSNSLKSYLQEMKEKNESIDLLVVTHIDNDHINGIIKLLEENGDYSQPKVIPIKEIWFNALRHLKIAESDKKLSDAEREEKSKKILQGVEIFNHRESGTHEIAGYQGYTLQELICKFHYEIIWNRRFQGEPVSIDHLNDNTEIFIGPLKLKLLSPNLDKLGALKKDWLEHLKKKGIDENQADFEDEYEKYLQSLDYFSESVEIQKISSTGFDIDKLSEVNKVDTQTPNGSSIAFTLEFHGIRALFLGDAHNDLIESQLSKLPDSKRKFRLVKLSHHGSNGNTGSLKNPNGLLNLINSEEYLISTNGGHNHPDMEAIAKIIKKNTGKGKKISCNYQNLQFNKVPMDFIKKANIIDFYFNLDDTIYHIDLMKGIN